MAKLPRYSLVCWLGPADLEPMPGAITVGHKGQKASVLRIPAPFGQGTDVVIAVIEYGDERTLKVMDDVDDELLLDVRDLQSNPRRYDDGIDEVS